MISQQNITVLVSDILELEIYNAPDRIVELYES